jgi:hypothetical protein
MQENIPPIEENGFLLVDLTLENIALRCETRRLTGAARCTWPPFAGNWCKTQS